MRVCTMHLRWLSAGLVIAVGLVAWLGLAWPASASIGVGVQANPVSLTGTAHPGASYTLPSLYIVNTGTQAESMSVRVVRRTGAGPGHPGILDSHRRSQRPAAAEAIGAHCSRTGHAG